jgi:hypothetical protein
MQVQSKRPEKMKFILIKIKGELKNLKKIRNISVF